MAELQQAYGKSVKAELIEGDNGIFEVVVDGRTLFSKKQAGRFPAYREIPNLIDEQRLRA